VHRRAFIAGSVALLGAPLAAEAQEPRRIPRIGRLVFGACAGPDSFDQALVALGYVSGQNVVIECRAGADYGRLPQRPRSSSNSRWACSWP